ncbi:MAG: zinc-finger domain-containing protein [Parvibaculales bacterium]
MADQAKPKFSNDQGVQTIRIGVKQFECIGASKPYDHPHIFLDMGRDSNIICPYCSTVYEYDASLQTEETIPADCLAD